MEKFQSQPIMQDKENPQSRERRGLFHTKEIPVRLLVDSVEEVSEGRKECDSLFTFLKYRVADPKR